MGKLTHCFCICFILLYHGNSYVIITAPGHCPVVQYGLGAASVTHLLLAAFSLSFSLKGKFKTDLSIHVNPQVCLNIHLNLLGQNTDFKFGWKMAKENKKLNFITVRTFLKPLFMPKYSDYYHV